MNRALGHFCVHKSQIGPGEPSENGEMSEMRKNFFCFFQTTETGKRNPNSSVKGSGANHYARAPALHQEYGYKGGL